MAELGAPDTQAILLRIDKVHDLLQTLQISRAGDVAATNTRLDYIEKTLSNLDSIVSKQGEQQAHIQVMQVGLNELKKQSEEREERQRLLITGLGSLRTDYDEHIEATIPLVAQFRDTQKLVWIGLGIAIILNVVFNPYVQSLLAR